MWPSLDLTKTALAAPPTWRKPGVAVGGGALLGAGLGAGIGALSADPDQGESRWGRAGAGALLGGAAGAAAGTAAADWGTVNPFDKKPKAAKPAADGEAQASSSAAAGAPAAQHQPKAVDPAKVQAVAGNAAKARAAKPPAADAPEVPHSAAPISLNEHGETNQTFSLGKFDDYRFNPNHAYSMTMRGEPDVVRFVGTTEGHPEIPQFESLTRVRGSTGKPVRFNVPDPDEIEGNVLRLQPHEKVLNDMAADMNHPAIQFISTGDAHHLEPIRTKAPAKPQKKAEFEFWASTYFSR